jgi:DNA replication initiation complex subunit (GINS family)
MESGKSGTHVIYKKKGKKMTRVGCTSDPDGAVKARYAAEKGMIKEEDKLMESIKMMVREELNALEEKKRKRKKKKKKKKAAKKDACYYKVKARYSVWPSAYASGALVKCRKVGAKNWGKSKK